MKEMSVWEYMAAVEGYAKAHNPEQNGGLSETEKDELWELVQERG